MVETKTKTNLKGQIMFSKSCRERERNAKDQQVVPPFQNNEIEEIDVESDVVDNVDVLFNENDLYPSHLK
jgi:hypothetical protein